MRLYGAMIICVLIATGLSACGNGANEADTGNGSTEPEPAGIGETLSESSNKAAFRREHPGSARYGSPPLEFEADPSGDLAYTTDEVTAKDGNVTIEFTNPQPTPHNVAIEAVKDGRVVTETVSEDFAATTITLSSNERYVFYCTVPGHRKAGMKGVVKVVPRE
jgi:plastocyanin